MDKNLDANIFIETLHNNPKIVQQIFSQIKTDQDVIDAIQYVYSNTQENKKLIETVDYISKNINILKKIADIISQLLNYGWDGIDQITVIPATSPIFPRFIETNSFMVPYFWSKKSIFRICAHEMTHFLYFKKIKELTNEKIDTEYPSKDWLLSEIVAPIIVNNTKLEKYIEGRDEFFSPDNGIISKDTIIAIEKLFYEESDLIKFRQLALQKLKYGEI